MPMNQRTHDALYPMIKEIWGETCSHCRKTPDELSVRQLEIHHKNGDDDDHRIENLRFLCHACNHLPQFRKKILMEEREYTPEHKKSIKRKPVFLHWLANELMEHNWHIGFDDAVDSGSYISGCDVVTIRRWLKPLLSKKGPYILWTDQKGEPSIYLKGKEPYFEEGERKQ